MTARARSSASALWPPLDPPVLTRLPQSQRHPDPASLPASTRYRASLRPTLQDEAELLDYEEDHFYNAQADTRAHGYTWLVPLGRLNTQEEDAESACSPSPPPDPAEQSAEEIPPANGGQEPDGAAHEDAPVVEVDLDADIEDASDPDEPDDPNESESDAEGDDEPQDEGINSDLNSGEDDNDGLSDDGTGTGSSSRAGAAEDAMEVAA